MPFRERKYVQEAPEELADRTNLLAQEPERKFVLLTPGPVMTSEEVRQAAAQPDMNHRDPAYIQLVQDVKQRLRSVYPQTGPFVPYLLGGGGTVAMEAMLTSCVERGPVLVIANGYYSERLDAILHVYGVPCETLHFPWLDPWDLDVVREQLESQAYEAVVCVHHETTTGRLNPVEEVAVLAKERGCRVLVDAVSSFGADPLDVENVDAICSTANKCLQGLPGISFVLVRPSLADEMTGFRRRNYAMSLPMYAGDSPPITPPVPLLAALREALAEFEREGGIVARRARYQANSDRIRRGLKDLGLSFAIPERAMSCSLTTATVPRGMTYREWFDRNYQAGFMIYGCKGEMAEEFFQVSTMGLVTEEMVEAWLETISAWL